MRMVAVCAVLVVAAGCGGGGSPAKPPATVTSSSKTTAPISIGPPTTTAPGVTFVPTTFMLTPTRDTTEPISGPAEIHEWASLVRQHAAYWRTVSDRVLVINAHTACNELRGGKSEGETAQLLETIGGVPARSALYLVAAAEVGFCPDQS